MEKTNLVQNLFGKKNKDYTYAVGFFFIFSFFIFYIIRPNLITVFEIKSKINQLKKIDREYAEQIDKIVTVQSEIEKNREDWIYLDEAISVKPEVNKILSDVNVSSLGSALKLDRVVISDINLKDKGSVNKMKSFTINMNLVGPFEDAISLLRLAYHQRRLKLVPDLEIAKDITVASDTAKLKIKMDVEGYFL